MKLNFNLKNIKTITKKNEMALFTTAFTKTQASTLKKTAEIENGTKAWTLSFCFPSRT
jgi:hypothetical protein